MIIKEFWHTSPLESKIKSRDYLEIGNNVVVESLFSLVSNGTERIVAKGLVPEELKNIMQVPFMEGSFDFPVKYGYSLVGKVLQGERSLIGKTVHIMHPHQDYAIIPENHLTLIPKSVPPQRAVLASNFETAVNAVWDSNISIGDTILVCGFGIIGALISLIAKDIPGVHVFVHEIDTKRKQIAASLGFSIFEANMINSQQFDLAFNTSVSAGALQLCIDTTLPNSKIIEVSWYGKSPVNIRLGGSFHTGRKQIVSSQVSAIPLNKQNRYNFKTRKQLVFDLLQNEVFDKLPLQIIAFDEMPELFHQMRNNVYKEFATIVKY